MNDKKKVINKVIKIVSISIAIILFSSLFTNMLHLWWLGIPLSFLGFLIFVKGVTLLSILFPKPSKKDVKLFLSVLIILYYVAGLGIPITVLYSITGMTLSANIPDAIMTTVSFNTFSHLLQMALLMSLQSALFCSAATYLLAVYLRIRKENKP